MTLVKSTFSIGFGIADGSPPPLLGLRCYDLGPRLKGCAALSRDDYAIPCL
jgi:hypothetical protein